EARESEEAADRRHARVLLHGETRAIPLRVLMHRAELVKNERLPEGVLAPPVLVRDAAIGETGRRCAGVLRLRPAVGPHAAVEADARLLEDDGSARGELDERRDREHEGREQD